MQIETVKRRYHFNVAKVIQLRSTACRFSRQKFVRFLNMVPNMIWSALKLFLHISWVLY